MPLFDMPKVEIDKKYSLKVAPPQYVPSADKPNMYELYDKSKYVKLLSHISKADIPEDVREFLKLGATRHIVFNYAKIADFYAHTTSEIQELMEESALVIIDIDDAIMNGYVKLNNNIKKIMEESGQKTNEE